MKANIINKLTVLFFSVGLSGAVFASGFQCESIDAREGLNVRVFNHVTPGSGTRVPAVLVVSTSQQGTVLVRREQEIRKVTRANSVQYVVEGSRKLDADRAILQISFREGHEVLEGGETVEGQLILVQDDGFRSVHQLACTRYLKSEE